MGKSPAQIVQQLHDLMRDTDYPLPQSYGVQSVLDDIVEAIGRFPLSDERESSIERHVWKERFEEIFRAIYPQAKAGNLEAIDRLLKIHDIMAKLIPGLHPPQSPCAAPCCMSGMQARPLSESPAIVTILDWPAWPDDNAAGFAEPGDPATDVEITKMLMLSLGREVGTEVGQVVVEKLAEIAARRATTVEAPGPCTRD